MVCSTSSWVVRVSDSTPSEGEGVQGMVRTGWGRLVSYSKHLGEQQHIPEVAIVGLLVVKQEAEQRRAAKTRRKANKRAGARFARQRKQLGGAETCSSGVALAL